MNHIKKGFQVSGFGCQGMCDRMRNLIHIDTFYFELLTLEH
jgi:hypothetical protein